MVEAEIAVTAIMVAVLMQALEVLKKRGEAAEAASRRKTRLLASLSHDLRTPLGTINLIAQLIQRTAGPSAPGAQLKTLAQGLEKNVMSVSACSRTPSISRRSSPGGRRCARRSFP
jgi:signal transduction histidine kinase